MSRSSRSLFGRHYNPASLAANERDRSGAGRPTRKAAPGSGYGRLLAPREVQDQKNRRAVSVGQADGTVEERAFRGADLRAGVSRCNGEHLGRLVEPLLT